jgi:hypothetical protein
MLLKAINSFLATNLKIRLVIIDNSPTNDLADIKINPKVEYIFNPSNPGYGTSHNIGIKKYWYKSKYHLVLNPDIYYDSGVIEDIILFMEKDAKVGLVMPKILYPDGNTQYLAKLLPTPFDLFARRLLPNSTYKQKLIEKFELRFSGYDTVIEAPYLSGCFMVFKTETLQKLDGFDENIFMHMEDLDISRRCNEADYKTIFYPKQVVYHDHKFKSFFTIGNLKMYSRSAVYYFNKWGWVFDENRKLINKATLNQFNVKI